MTTDPPVVLLAHGAGSTPDAAARLLGPVVPEGCVPVAVDARGGIDDVVAALARAAEGRVVRRAAGISLGAHAVAAWAASAAGRPELALVMPAWTAAPDSVAALTAASADELERIGVDAVLAGLPADDWVVDELARAWRGADADVLAEGLRAAALSAGPGLELLAALPHRAAVVALADDPLHPEAVARAWVGAMPRARLAVVGRRAPDLDRAALGRAAAQLLDDRFG